MSLAVRRDCVLVPCAEDGRMCQPRVVSVVTGEQFANPIENVGTHKNALNPVHSDRDAVTAGDYHE